MVTYMGSSTETPGPGGMDGFSHADFFYWNPDPGPHVTGLIMDEMLAVLRGL